MSRLNPVSLSPRLPPSEGVEMPTSPCATARTSAAASAARFARICASLCPGREPPFLAVKRPARPYKRAIQTRFTMGNAEGASPPRAGPDRRQLAVVRRAADQPDQLDDDTDERPAREGLQPAPHLGFGRIVASEIEVPNLLAIFL